MTYDDLFNIGCNRGLVQWTRSRRIEKLRVTKTTAGGRHKGQQVLMVSRLESGSPEHPIFRPTSEPHEFYCVELSWKTPVSLSDIFQ